MGCIQIRVKPNTAEKSKSNVSHADTVQDISGEADISKAYSTVVYRNPLPIPTKLVVSSVMSNESEDLTSCLEAIISRTAIESTESNNDHNNVNKEIAIESDKPNPLNNITIGSPSIRSNKFNDQFLSARSNGLNTHQESIHDNNYNESDTSFPTHASIISTTSIDSEGSVASRIEHKKDRFVLSKQLNLQQKSSSKSDESKLQHEKRDSSAVVDMELMTKYLMTTLRATSTKLSNSDFHHSEPCSETESDTGEF